MMNVNDIREALLNDRAEVLRVAFASVVSHQIAGGEVEGLAPFDGPEILLRLAEALAGDDTPLPQPLGMILRERILGGEDLATYAAAAAAVIENVNEFGGVTVRRRQGENNPNG